MEPARTAKAAGAISSLNSAAKAARAVSKGRAVEGAVEDADGGGDEAPAAAADVGGGAAGAHGVVVGHVDVEDELAELRAEGGGADGLFVAGLRARTSLLSVWH